MAKKDIGKSVSNVSKDQVKISREQLELQKEMFDRLSYSLDTAEDLSLVYGKIKDSLDDIKSLNENHFNLLTKENKLISDKKKLTLELNQLDESSNDYLAQSMGIRREIIKTEYDLLENRESIKNISEKNVDLLEKQAEYDSLITRRAELKNKYESANLKINTETNLAYSQAGGYLTKLLHIDEKRDIAGKSLSSTQAIMNQLLEEEVEPSSELFSITSRLNKIVNDNTEQELEQIKTLQEKGILAYREIDVTGKQNELVMQRVQLEQSGVDITQGTGKALMDNILAEEKRVEVLRESNKTYMKGKQAAEAIGSSVEQGMSRLTGIIDVIPGGKMISSKLGLDQIGKDINDKVSKRVTESFAQSQGGMMGFAKAGMSGIQGLTGALMGPAGLMIGIGLVVAAIGGIISMFNGADQAVSEMQKTMEVSKGKAVELQGAATGIAGEMNMVGVNTKEVMETMGGLREAFGGLRIDPTANAEMKGLVEQTTLLTNKFGLSAQESKDLYDTSKILGVSMEELTTSAATFGDKTIGAKESLKELSKLPKGLVAGFKGSAQALAAAAVKAKMMGTSLEKMKSIGDGMLDIESSLNAEMEARVLTGKNINLDKARELALSGDVAGLQDEVLNQMGSLEDFRKLDIMGQKAMADAMGMSVDEMTEMLTAAEANKAMGIDSAKMKELEAASLEEINKLAADAANGNNKAYADKLKQMAAEKESATLQEKMSNIMTKIQEKVQKLILPLVEMVHALFDSTDAAGGLMGVFDTISSVLGSIFSVVGFIFKILFKLIGVVLTPIFTIFSEIGKVVGELFSSVSSLFASTEEGGETVDYIGEAFTMIGSVVSGLAGVIAAVLIGPLKFVVGIITSIIKLFTGDFAGGVKGIGDSIKGFIFGPIEKIGEMFDNVFGTNISGAIKNITSLFDPIINIFSEIYGTYLMGIVNMLKTIGGHILTYLMTPINTVMSIFSGIGQILSGDLIGGLQTIGQSILDYILAPFNLVIGIVTSIVDFIQSMVEKATSLGGAIGAAADTVGSVLGAIGFGGDDEEDDKQSGSSITPKAESTGSPVTPKADGGKVESSTGYTLVGEKGPELVQLPRASNVITADQTSNMVSSGNPVQTNNAVGSGGIGGNDKVIQLLEQILAVASQEVQVKLGDTFVHEMDSRISLRSGMRMNMDKTWGKT